MCTFVAWETGKLDKIRTYFVLWMGTHFTAWAFLEMCLCISERHFTLQATGSVITKRRTYAAPLFLDLHDPCYKSSTTNKYAASLHFELSSSLYEHWTQLGHSFSFDFLWSILAVGLPCLHSFPSSWLPVHTHKPVRGNRAKQWFYGTRLAQLEQGLPSPWRVDKRQLCALPVRKGSLCQRKIRASLQLGDDELATARNAWRNS
jgi:hypothetical protein